MATLEAGTPSPKGPLSKLRKGRKGGLDNPSTLSVASSSEGADLDENGTSSIRASMDGAFDKLKDRARKSVDKRRGSVDDQTNRLSTLLAGKKRRTKQDAEDAERTMSNDSTSPGNGSFTLNGNSSERSLSGSRHSSQMTEDYSDNEGYVQ